MQFKSAARWAGLITLALAGIAGSTGCQLEELAQTPGGGSTAPSDPPPSGGSERKSAPEDVPDRAPRPELVANAGSGVSIATGLRAILSGSAAGGTPPYTFAWSPADGLSAVDAPNPGASPLRTTTYTLTVIDSAARRATDSVQVTVTPIPPTTDGALPDGALFTQGNGIFIRTADGAAAPFRARGANLQDTRGCGYCLYEPSNAAEVQRRAAALVGDWGADFVRLTLESRPIPDNPWARPAPGVLDDPAYADEIAQIVSSITDRPGKYVLLSLWIEPTVDENGWPTPQTDNVWTALAERFVDNPKVMFGIVNEPINNFDGAQDAACWEAMNRAASAIRAVEAAHDAAKHVILAQGTGWWSRRLEYYVSHPLSAGGGENIAYEIHFYNPAEDIDALLSGPAAQIPVVIGEFGPDQQMTVEDCRTLMDFARAADISYLAWTFHYGCAPNLLLDTRDDAENHPCGIGMPLAPSAWGQMLIDEFAVPW
ncbi:Cellulase (glycosyl hydrolase family 5) [Phycisphaerae bacterium RAS1]|nr:Cellulase (glycosyl hydrolase family 5) [Phycisphaerae bacterium RAS1]